MYMTYTLPRESMRVVASSSVGAFGFSFLAPNIRFMGADKTN